MRAEQRVVREGSSPDDLPGIACDGRMITRGLQGRCWWCVSGKTLNFPLRVEYFDRLGMPHITATLSNRPVRICTPDGVAEELSSWTAAYAACAHFVSAAMDPAARG